MILSNRLTEQGYVDLGRQDFMGAIKPYISAHGYDQLEFAYPTSKYAHRPQTRDDGTRYFEHPKTVAWLIFERYQIYSWRTLVIALLHDVIEDSFMMKEDRMKLNWGKVVSRGVVVLSKNTIPKKFRGDDDGAYYRRIESQGSWQCQVVKLVDRIHNLSTSESLPAERRARKIRETVEYFPAIIVALAGQVPLKYLPAVDKMRQDLADLCTEWAAGVGESRPTAFDFPLAA